MKIERINENQIRCTLTSQELAQRHMSVSELAYGSEKAKLLFRELIQQASFECGFETDDFPILVEAIPLAEGELLLNVTKVEYPEELDTRFSNFSPSSYDIAEESDMDSLTPFSSEAADSILDLFRHLSEAAGVRNTSSEKEKMDRFVPLHESAQTVPTASHAHTGSNPAKKPVAEVATDLTKLFCFQNLSHLIRLSHVLHGFYNGRNDLYYDSESNHYYLIIHKSDHSPSEFNKVCNILSEYALQCRYQDASKAFFDEHFRLIASEDALNSIYFA